MLQRRDAKVMMEATMVTRKDAKVEFIVLGGGISRSPQWFLPATQAQIRDLRLDLRISSLQDRAPLMGCGFAWFERIAMPAIVDAAAPAPGGAMHS